MVLASRAKGHFCVRTKATHRLFQDAAVSAFRAAYEKTVGLSYRMDVTFFLCRIGLFYLDHDLVTRNVEKAKA